MYQPNPVPDAQSDLISFLRNELAAIARQLTNVDSIQLPTLYAEPAKVNNGMIVLADGVTWNPGGGAGVYARVAGAWVKL